MTILTRLLVLLALLVPASLAQAQSEYRLRQGDTVIVEVLEDPTLNRSVVVLPDGRISFPYAGTLAAAGRSVGEVQASIGEAIRANFASPPTVFVTVQPAERAAAGGNGVARTRTIDVYFLGEVNTPGIKEVAPGTTFLQALAQSGGLTRFAATKRVQLRRTDPVSGQMTVYRIDYRAMAEGAAAGQDVTLRKGDVILVPERRLFE